MVRNASHSILHNLADLYPVEIKYGVQSEQDIQGAVTGAHDDPDGLHSNIRSGSLHIRHVAEMYEKGWVENSIHIIARCTFTVGYWDT